MYKSLSKILTIFLFFCGVLSISLDAFRKKELIEFTEIKTEANEKLL